MSIDQIALLPAYAAAGTAALALLMDLLMPGRRLPVVIASSLGTGITAVACVWAYREGARSTFCVDAAGCSYSWDATAVLVGLTFAATTLVVLLLSTPVLRAGAAPAGEYCFLLGCAMTGGVVLGAARDLITLIVALETLTLPLYVLVGLRRRPVGAAGLPSGGSAGGSVPPMNGSRPAGNAEASLIFFVVSVVATSVTLLGAGLLYAATGTVHFDGLRQALTGRGEPAMARLMGVAVVLLLVGLAFKVAAVPFHAWAPATYDGAPLPVAAYLSTASKLGGVIALILVLAGPLRPWLDVAGAAMAVLAVLTMTVGNLAALRQQRMVRLLAWSSVAQAGYILAPLGAAVAAAGRTADAITVAVSATLAYTIFYLLLELTAFGSVIALRGPVDGGAMADYRGAASARPWVAGAFVIAVTGLAGLPPALAGLFAKVVVVRALLAGGAGWLAVIVAINAVIGLAYYLRAGLSLFGRSGKAPTVWPRLPVAVGLCLTVVTAAALVIGFAPQWVFEVAPAAAP
ncbi:MAG TPA: proton-conducting transporter membrane subunit [Micromonosporaceae bacterium]